MISGLVFAADSNGIWNLAKNVRSGIFGEDEVGYGDNNFWYTFNNPVRFLKNITNDFRVEGEFYDNGSMVLTLNVSWKVPFEQLPFHKGDLLVPTNRLSSFGVDSYYFDISNLDVDSSTLKASKVPAENSAYVNGVKIDGTKQVYSYNQYTGHHTNSRSGDIVSIYPTPYKNSVCLTNYIFTVK